ncbi:MAG: CoA activase [Nitrospirae bacterium]|nr:CoA activase [Nitrospirota bacterium]
MSFDVSGGVSGDGSFFIGLDVGSTTVKAVVIDAVTDKTVWCDYQRHETMQQYKVLEFLQAIEKAFPNKKELFRIFVTGSGGRTVAPFIGAKFVQEVNAVSLAVEKLHPEAGSVIELGGQDAKIIIWVEDTQDGNKRKLSSMNDKCAGGTGAVIDKIIAKLSLGNKNISTLRYKDIRLHPVAGKCGVFAETDINSLQKQGIPPEELMASLFEAIVQQNLSVLTRGNTLRPNVLLLGGPNTFIPALQEAWQHHIPNMWKERGVQIQDGVNIEELIYVPDNSQYYAAIGSVIYGRSEDEKTGRYKGTKELEEHLAEGQKKSTPKDGMSGLTKTSEELGNFLKDFKKEPFKPAVFKAAEIVPAYIGIDGGSTSTKGVLLNKDGVLLAKSYLLSKGNPIDDTREILKDLRRQIESQGAFLEVKGVGTTGYAKDMLKECFSADVAIVETVAHTSSALYYFNEVDVIVDVGGQDIKVIFLKNRRVRDFKLNTQCSAGNGYFLQNTAEKFGFNVTEYSERAFKAERMPQFHYGCAVFLESDIVNFQQQGWDREEIMAGLAHVLPKNIWLYVVQEPNLRKFGKIFVLQGGTQHNLAAVKSQYDFIKSRVPDAEIHVHKYTGESGAIGAALEAIRIVKNRTTNFIGLDAAEDIRFAALRDESTRCHFCENKCQRTFIDIEGSYDNSSKRYIIASCEKGIAEDVKTVQAIKKRLDELKRQNPDLSELSAKVLFKSRKENNEESPKFKVQSSNDIVKTRNRKSTLANLRSSIYSTFRTPKSEIRTNNYDIAKIKVGFPRVLNMYSVSPFFIAWFEKLGVDYKNIIFSDYTNQTMYKEGSRRGSIDGCFPGKVALSHIHNLLYTKKQKPDVIFFPILLNLPSELKNTTANASCPTVAATPEVVKAAFTKEEDSFLKNNTRFLNPHFNMAEPALFERQMFLFGSELFGISKEENQEAMDAGYLAMAAYSNDSREKASEILQKIEKENRVGVVLLGRPYHNDPGLNHEILTEIQRYGYPILTVESLPVNKDIIERLYGEELRRGEISHPMEISDVWKNSFSENTNIKLWGAKYIARHPNLVAVDLSNFRCGHDAPVYSVVEEILSATNTPYFTFHDIDENKPTGSIKIRVETIHYFLQKYEDDLKIKNEMEELVWNRY